MDSEIEPMDEGAVQRRSKRCMELAAMFKEVNKGNIKALYKIMAKFRLQEGVSKKVASAYLSDLKETGLVRISKGNKSWRYDPEEEWDLFKIDI